MTINDPRLEHNWLTLKEAKERCLREIIAFEMGLRDIMIDLGSLINALYELQEMFKNLKKSNNIVSINEFNRIKKDLYTIKTAIHTKKSGKLNIEHEIRKRKKEIKQLDRLIKKIEKEMRRGTILDFKKR